METVTELLKDPVSGDFVPVKETTNTYWKFVRLDPAWTFDRIVEATTGSGAQARTTYSFYEDDPESIVFGKLIAQYNSDGTWVRHEYGTTPNHDGELAPIKTFTPWLDEAGLSLPANATRSQILAAILAVPAAQCRVEEVQYLTDPDRTIRKVTVAGVLVSTETETRIVVIDPFTGDRVLEKQRVLRDGTGQVLTDTREGLLATAEAQEQAWETVLYTIQADGTRMTREETVDFAQNNLQAETVTHGTSAQPAGVTGRSLREIHTRDADGPIRSASELKLAGSYTLLEETLYQNDEVNGARVERVFTNGEETQTTTHHLDGSIETVDASGVTTVQHTDPETGVTTLTRMGGDAITEGAVTLFSGADMVTTTETFPLPVLAGGDPAGWRELVTTQVGGVSRVESETEFDVHGRVVRVTDAQGITRTTSWTRAANGTETQTETLPGGATRITSFYQDGRVRSVTGTALVAQHYDYEMLPGGKLRQTTYQHQQGSSRWQRTLTDAAGRVIREESPGAGSQLESLRIWSERRYNDLGHLVELKRSGGLAAELYEYDALGRVFRRGLDANGNGQLDMQSNDSLTEFHEGYEQRAGVWWQVQRTRVYVQAGEFLEYGRRTQVGGGSETMSESIDPGGVVTTVQVILDRATATRTTRTLRPGTSEPEESVEKQGLLIKSRSAQTHPVWVLQEWTDFREMAKVHQPGGIRAFLYDATGRLVSETLTAADASDQVTTYSYLPANVLNAGKLASRTAPYSPLANGAVSTVYYQYDALGRETAQWGPGTYPVQYGYNEWGERNAMRTWRTQSDGSALPPVNEASLTTWEYDPGSGLLLAKKDAENRQTAYSYRTGTRLLSARQWARQNGQGQPLATLYEHDALGRLTQISYNDGITHSVRYSYRRDGSVAAIEDAAGRRVMSDWSAQGRAQREVITASSLQDRPDLLVGLQWQQPLDALGRRAGHSGQFAHGGIALELPSATWAYDAATGRMSSVQSGGLTAAWAWSHSATQSTRTLTRSASGSQAQPSLTSVQEQNLGRGLFSHSHSRSGSVIQSRTRGTLANSHQIEYRDPHFGVVGGANEMSTWIYGSDARGQITSARKRLDAAAGAPFTPGWDASYTYDDLGNRVTWGQGSAQQTDLSDLEPTSYSRNALHQYTAISGVNASRVTGQAPAAQEVKINGVTAERAGHFYHRRVQDGARSDLTLPHWLEVTVTAMTALPNQQTVTAQRAGSLWQPPIPEEPVYDFDGNLVEDGRWLYTWDGEQRLVQMLTRPAAVAAGAPNWRLSFAYDHQSRRIQKKVEVLNGAVWEMRSDARFIYDGWNVVAEVELNGAAWDAPGGTSAMTLRPAYVRRSWVWGEDVSGTLDGAGGVGGLLVVTRHARGGQGRESYWAMSDLNGNVTGLVSTSSTRMAVYEYDAFGRLLRENEPEPGLNPVRFSSKYQDVETGLVYYGYRYYAPEMGRWISRDPMFEITGELAETNGGGPNLYGMVANDPINTIDLYGLRICHRERIDYKLGGWKFDVWKIKAEFSLTIRGQLTICDDCTRQLAGRLTGQLAGQIPLWAVPGFTLSGTASGELHGQIDASWTEGNPGIDASGSVRLTGWGGLSGGNDLASVGGDIGASTSWTFDFDYDGGNLNVHANGQEVKANARARVSFSITSRWKYNQEILRYQTQVGAAPDFDFNVPITDFSAP